MASTKTIPAELLEQLRRDREKITTELQRARPTPWWGCRRKLIERSSSTCYSSEWTAFKKNRRECRNRCVPLVRFSRRDRYSPFGRTRPVGPCRWGYNSL